MARRGSIATKMRVNGETWIYRYFVTRPADGKLIERTAVVGLVSEIGSKETAAWTKVGEMGLDKLINKMLGPDPTFKEIAEHFRNHELRSAKVGIGKRAAESITRDEHNLDIYLIPRWGDQKATAITVPAVESWFDALSITSRVKGDKTLPPLSWPTISKFRDVMSMVYRHAQRHKLIPVTMESNPLRSSKFGGARCKSDSSYEAKVATPDQVVAILTELDRPETRIYWTLVLVCAATALRPHECFGLRWSDLDWKRGQINLSRGWSKGRTTEGKVKKAMTQVAMHPALALHLEEWRKETLYSKETDWVFASVREKGRIPLAASTAAKKHLRPAAVTAGVIVAGESTRFGWGNLRHSLATWMASNVDLKTAQSALRHSKISTTAEVYSHRVHPNLVAAQGKFMGEIKLVSDSIQ